MANNTLTILILILCPIIFSENLAISQKTIQFSNKKGIPFYKAYNDYCVEGFTVDNNGSFYFLSGPDPNHSSILVKYSENYKELYRVNFRDMAASPLFYYDSMLLRLSNDSIVIISPVNGSVLNKIPLQTNVHARVNSYRFFQGNLICDFGSKYGLKSNLYTLDGKMVGDCKNQYCLTCPNGSSIIDDVSGEIVLGKWKTLFVIDSFCLDKRIDYILLKDSTGKIIAKSEILHKTFGGILYQGFPENLWSMTDKYIYRIGSELSSLRITKIDLEILFPQIK